MASGLRLDGRLTFCIHDAATMDVIDVIEQGNLVVDTGLQLALDLLIGATTDTITHMAVASGGATPAAGDTTLSGEQYRTTIVERTRTAKTITLKALVPSGEANGTTLTNAGLFTAAAAGTLVAHTALTTPVAKTSSIAITMVWTVDAADA